MFRLNAPFGFFFLLIPLAILVYYILSKTKIKRGVLISGVTTYQQSFSLRIFLHYFGVASIFVGLFALALSLTGPQFGVKKNAVEYTGIDILLVFDVSPSMLYRDYGNYTRLDVAKFFTSNFVNKRQGDRIGLVTFATNSMLKAPATTNHELLVDIIKRIKIDPEKRASTSIGLGLASGINRLIKITDNTKTNSKIIILITDGENNSGEITPETAMNIAKDNHIKVYTVGIGTAEELDMNLLETIAKETGGEFFFARNSKEIEATFKTIDEIEKVKLHTVDISNFNDISYLVAAFGLFFFLLGFFCYGFIGRRLG